MPSSNLCLGHRLCVHDVPVGWQSDDTCTGFGRYMAYVQLINALDPTMRALSDAELQSATPRLRARLAAGETLERLLPEAFAVVREASVRVLGMRHYDVQLVRGLLSVKSFNQ